VPILAACSQQKSIHYKNENLTARRISIISGLVQELENAK